LSEIDFIHAFSRLLGDGALRAEFAKNPAAVAERLGVQARERGAFVNLDPEEVEFQALVLLHKRFDVVRRLIPSTCATLSEDAWALFAEYACNCQPGLDFRDAHDFCQFVLTKFPAAVSRSELNRLRFGLGQKSLAVHFVRDLRINERVRCGLQLLIRGRRSAWREDAIYFSL
jgi:hypothetical protein